METWRNPNWIRPWQRPLYSGLLGRATGESIRERFALEELHHEEGDPRLLTDIVARADVGVRQPRNRSRLTVEPLPELRIAGQVGGEDLDRDDAIEPRVSALVHLAHATLAKLRGDFVDAEACARGESQVCCRL